MDPDPLFPNRPTHPDFDLLSKAAIENDRLIDQHVSTVESVLGRHVDIASLDYMARNRAAMAVASARDKTPIPDDLPEGVTEFLEGALGDVANHAMQAGFLDGFALGCAYMESKDTRVSFQDDAHRRQ